MLKPLEISTNYVLIKRNSILCAGIGYVSGRCLINSDNPRYTYGCLSENAYTLTIPADNMTDYEQNSQWHCESIANSSYRSPRIILNIAGTICSYLSKWFIPVFCLRNPTSHFLLWIFVNLSFFKPKQNSYLKKLQTRKLTNQMLNNYKDNKTNLHYNLFLHYAAPFHKSF